ncbi:alpha/beta hydrolase [Croceitalea rosinachiae]|uniref:Alpha/beta hydrolase n=1 Tax=Croceitalea rosinachiae TaxID=3075596 RepID=A0ABU3ABS0_9FLAO|nr:alpha/beta hydrolase [Croceitalea sp. F388]MDT0607615.1 alpha/beta hydrolase [Croceitalea sp. F388]
MKTKTWLLVLYVILYGCTNMSSIENQHRDVRYANDSAAQKMDIFIPDGAGPFPAVLLIHGGGFKSGDKKAKYSLAKILVANEYVAICVNYRLSGEAIFPAAIHDIKAAIRFTRGNAANYSVNPDRIGCWGSSAGGNLSAMIGTSAGNKYIDGSVGFFKNESTKIQACVDWFGPIDFTTMKRDAKQLGFKESFNVVLESKYIGADISAPENFHLVQSANPETYIDDSDPPFYVQVGNKDPLIPYIQSQSFAHKLYQVLGKEDVRFEVIEGGKHGGAKFSNKENIGKVITFLDKYLKQ